MKNENPVSKLLGVTQEEMAMLLGISRSQWSLYELGRRGLPLRASALLGEILIHAKAAKASKRIQPSEKSQQIMYEGLAKLVRENQFQKMGVERQIEKLKEKLKGDEARTHVLAFLTANENNKKKGEGMHGLLSRKVAKTLEKNRLGLLVELEIKLEVLRFEEELLNSRLSSKNLFGT